MLASERGDDNVAAAIIFSAVLLVAWAILQIAGDIGQGRDAVKQFLFDNPEVMEEIEGRIREALQQKD